MDVAAGQVVSERCGSTDRIVGRARLVGVRSGWRAGPAGEQRTEWVAGRAGGGTEQVVGRAGGRTENGAGGVPGRWENGTGGPVVASL